MPKKPINLTYGVEDNPPTLITVLLGVQHVCIIFIGIIMPVMIIRLMGNNITPEEAQSLVSISLIAAGVSAFIQSYRMGPVGSGYLCPSVSGPAYFDASKSAALAGGLPLLFGMTLLAGVIEILFSRVMKKIRFLFPAEVTGLIVAMVGIVVLPLSVKNFFGIGAGDSEILPMEVVIGVITLMMMIGLNIWSRGNLKLYCTLIGMILGYILGIIFNVIPQSDIQNFNSASFFSFPQISHIKWSFDFTLIIPFAVATICSTFKTVGDLVTCQKINDADWKRVDMKTVSGGILADGLGGVIPGLIGGYGQSTSSSNVGLSLATGATSRRIAIPISLILIVLAFFPKLSEIFIIMPRPVIGAALIFSISFMITTGFQMMMSRMLDTRKIFVIGASLIFGLSVDMVPNLYSGVHSWIKPVFSSSLSLTTICAIGLNLLFRIGIAKKQTLVLRAGKNSADDILTFMEKQGGIWGARKEVIFNAATAMNEIMESINSFELTDKEVKMEVSFDEFNLDVIVTYKGIPFEFPDKKPTKEDLIKDESAALKLSAFMIKRFPDSLKTEHKEDNVKLILHFNH